MNTLTAQVNQNHFNNQQQHEYNMMQQMQPQQQQQQQQRSDSVSSIDASSTSLLYANKIFIEDFDHSDLVLTERVLTELEQILYNNGSGSGQGTDSKVKSHKMCPPGQTMAHGVSTSLPQLPVYHQQHSFRHYIAAAESVEGQSQEEPGFDEAIESGNQEGKSKHGKEKLK